MDTNYNKLRAQAKNRIQRFKDASWFKTDAMPFVSVFGVGSLGSYVAFFLSRMDCKVQVVDSDKLEPVNSSAQFYPYSYCIAEKPKVIALAEFLKDFVQDDVNIYPMQDRVTNEYVLNSSIVFSCFDNMEARKILFNKWASLDNREIFIDLRANMEEFSVFVVTKGNEQRYLDDFYDDSAIPDLPCSLKSTSHCSAMCASIAIGLFTNYLSNKSTGESIRELPYSTKISIPISFYDVQF